MPHACFLNKHKKHSNLQFSSIVEKKFSYVNLTVFSTRNMLTGINILIK